MSPAFQGVFLTTGPPGKPLYSLLYICKMVFAEHKPLIDGMWLTAEKVKTTNQPFVLESIRWVQDCELLETKNTCELNHNKRIHSLVLLEQRKEWDCPAEGACGKLKVWKWKSLSPVNSFQPHGLYSPWNSLGQNTGVSSLSLLQGIFPTQGSNPGLPHCRWILYQLSHR